MTTWPATLPAPLLAGYQETLADNTLRSQMDKGPDKVRRHTTANVRPLSFSLVLTATQLSALIAFYNTTTLGGSLAFDFTDIRTSETLSCRFSTPPVFSPVGGGPYTVNISLEVLP